MIFLLMKAALFEKYRPTNDKKLSIYIDFKNKVHIAGDIVEGAVNIFCGEDCPQYRFMRMTIFCSENVCWSVRIE